MVVISPLFLNQLNGYCARCVKIETEREKEQREHPHVAGYYDDQVEDNGNVTRRKQGFNCLDDSSQGKKEFTEDLLH